MPVRVVTDSTSDISLELAAELAVTVVPVYVHFGQEVFMDLVEMQPEDFYRRLAEGQTPTTAQPAPADFAAVYRELSGGGDEILSIHLTSKLSGTYNAALQGRELAATGTKIEIIDTLTTSMAMGLAVMAAARLAAAGESLAEIVRTVNENVARTRLYGIFDTIRYLQRGGRVGKAVLRLGSLLNIKPLLEMRHGELAPVGAVRVRAQGLEKMKYFLACAANPVEVAVVYNTFAAEAKGFRDEAAASAGCAVHLARLGPALGAHAGPGAMLVVVTEGSGIADASPLG